jgi:hypothetical protein
MSNIPPHTHPYYIITPSYDYASSGVRALHLLCHDLNKHGLKAYLFPLTQGEFIVNPFLDTPQLPHTHDLFYQRSDIEPIYIYPDIIRGNPLNGTRVVRWLLAEAGKYGGDATFPKTDMIFGYTKPIAHAAGTDRVLCLPTFDTNIFYQREERREGSCFYSHKFDRIHGNALPDIVKDSTRLEGPPKKLADILRKSEVCYVLEMSEIIINAQLCRCKVVLVKTPYFNHVPSNIDFPYWDVAWDDGERVQAQPGNIWAKDYKASFQDGMELLNREYIHQFAQFIKDTQEWKR